MTEPTTCNGCGAAAELCGDGYCEACHKSLSFSDCVDGTYSVSVLQATRSDESLRELYPNAKQWRAGT